MDISVNFPIDFYEENTEIEAKRKKGVIDFDREKIVQKKPNLQFL